jgi:serine/threonine protein kinase
VLAGEVLGRYRVLEPIGTGGMASVYAGEHMILHHRVAIKVLHPASLDDPVAEARFLNEARVISAIHHPSIVELFDLGRCPDGRPYVVMELLRGETLRARIERGPIDAMDALQLARQMASALGAAHAHHIIHRDIKPDNVFLVKDSEVWGGERVKVLDFGVAKHAAAAPGQDLTRTGVIVGTPAYMSPEQCLGEEIDARSDIYSLGVVMFQMVTGQLPFLSPSTGELLAEHLYLAPPPAHEVNPAIDRSISSVIARCLAKERDERFASMEELARALIELTDPARALTGRVPTAAMVDERARTIIRSRLPVDVKPEKTLVLPDADALPAAGDEVRAAPPRADEHRAHPRLRAASSSRAPRPGSPRPSGAPRPDSASARPPTQPRLGSPGPGSPPLESLSARPPSPPQPRSARLASPEPTHHLRDPSLGYASAVPAGLDDSVTNLRAAESAHARAAALAAAARAAGDRADEAFELTPPPRRSHVPVLLFVVGFALAAAAVASGSEVLTWAVAQLLQSPAVTQAAPVPAPAVARSPADAGAASAPDAARLPASAPIEPARPEPAAPVEPPQPESSAPVASARREPSARPSASAGPARRGPPAGPSASARERTRSAPAEPGQSRDAGSPNRSPYDAIKTPTVY